MILSVLDTQPIVSLPQLVPELETLGYERYWTTEHQSARQSASAAVLIALAAGLTDRMRVGSGGVLLRSTSALRVAHDFAALELFFPGRIDLGIAGAMPAQEYLSEYERDVHVAVGAAYDERLERLVWMSKTGVLRGSSSPVGPRSASRPSMWLCGTSVRTARLAGQLGLSFAYHHQLAPRFGGDAREIGDAYRAAFARTADAPSPRLAVALYGSCGGSNDEATERWRAVHRDSPAGFLGDGARVAEQLRVVVADHGADELFVDCFAPSFDERLDGLSILASWAIMR